MIDVSGSSGKTYDVFFNPFGLSGPSLQTGLDQYLSVNVYYNDQSGNRYTDNLTVPVGSSNPTLTTTLSAPAAITWNSFTASWSGQDTAQNGGKVHVAVSGLAHPSWGPSCPTSLPTTVPFLLDIRHPWLIEPPERGPVRHSDRCDRGHCLCPLNNEAGATLTLRLDFGPPMASRPPVSR